MKQTASRPGLFLIGTRIGGAIMILLGIAGLVVTILGL